MNRQTRLTGRAAMGNARPDRGDMRGQERTNRQEGVVGQQTGESESRFRKDVGINMTDSQYTEHQDRYTTWDKELSGYEAEIAEGNKSIDTYSKNLEIEKAAKETELDALQKRLDAEGKKTLEDMWTKTEKDFVTVRIVNGADNFKVEGTYKMPDSVAKQYQDNGELWTNRVGNVLYIDVKTKSGRIRGEELHKEFMQNGTKLKAGYFKANLPNYISSRQDLDDGYGAINKARADLIESYTTTLGTLGTQKTNLLANTGQINNARASYAEEVQAGVDSYQEKKDKRTALFSQ